MFRLYPRFAYVEIAENLQQQCYKAWTYEPTLIGRIAEAARSLRDISKDPVVLAYSEWINAIDALVAGDLNTCLSFINSSETLFLDSEQTHLAAKTQTSKLYVLGLLGKYEEAVKCGLEAREVFLQHNDIYSAGKIEHNIGNLHWRRDLYKESEPFLASAHSRFEQIKDERQLAMVENCQAFVKTLQNDFPVAESLYNVALERAIRNDLTVTAAEIETGLSNLYLFKGHYDLALEFLERSRQKYDELAMPLQSAGCDLEIADIYLELNLLPEALQRYDRCISEFTVLGGQAELAKSYLGRARTLQRLGHSEKLRENLDAAQELFENEENSVAVGSVRLARAQEMLHSGFLEPADKEVSAALRIFKEGASIRLSLFARWLRCEIYFASGRIKDLEAELSDILEEATDSREIQYLCLVLLGRITGEQEYFISAVELVERSRIELAAPELRTSFFAEKLTPYNELVKICLSRKEYKEALQWHERSRSRSMVDVAEIDHGKDVDERTRRIREELNWFQRRHTATGSANESERSTTIELRKNIERLEREYAEILRRNHAKNRSGILSGIDLNIDEFRERLGDATAVEFITLDGKISVFVISKHDFSAVRDYLDEGELNAAIDQYLFQVNTGRFFGRLSPSDQISALERLKIRSKKLFEMIFKPIEHLIGSERIVVLASGKMHTLPFHSLFDGQKYLCERAVVSYSPSLSLLNEKLGTLPCDRKTALIAGVADSVIPLANVEIAEVSRYFERAVCLSGSEATISSIRDSLPGNRVFHLSCHGQFRPDNPSFSSLGLFNEKMTANDVRTLPLERCIVVLSSCEGAINEVVRGEELIGLTGAFFAAGASTLIHSLWRINDEAALELMVEFYKGFAAGSDPAKALNRAQLRMIERGEDPYLWAPFIVTGGW